MATLDPERYRRIVELGDRLTQRGKRMGARRPGYGPGLPPDVLEMQAEQNRLLSGQMDRLPFGLEPPRRLTRWQRFRLWLWTWIRG